VAVRETLRVKAVVDLDGFEPSTSSMPFKKYQSLADISSKNKGLANATWTPKALFLVLDSTRTP
jgi:hypothetical protein